MPPAAAGVRSMCRSCGRSVYVIALAGGGRLTLEAELIQVVPFSGPAAGAVRTTGETIPARRLHDLSVCEVYKAARERQARRKTGL